jgi:hypothetical protein
MERDADYVHAVGREWKQFTARSLGHMHCALLDHLTCNLAYYTYLEGTFMVEIGVRRAQVLHHTFLIPHTHIF